MTYIYALSDPIKLSVRYIGKTDNLQQRLIAHLSESRYGNTHKNNWIRKLLKVGLKPEIIILEECDDEIWIDREQYWIEYARENNWPITNIAEGGAGANLLGNNNGNRKVDERTVLEIRTKRAAGIRPKDLIKEYGLSSAQISAICLGQSWKHIGGPIVEKSDRPRSTLNDEDIVNIRIAYCVDKQSSQKLSDQYGLSRESILNIVRGDTFSYLGGPISRENHGLGRSEWARVIRLWEDGCAVKEIVRITQIPQNTIYGIIARNKKFLGKQ